MIVKVLKVIGLVIFGLVALVAIMGLSGTVLSGCAMQQGGGQAATAQPTAPGAAVDELDIAIRDASDYLNENIPRGSKIVIVL